MRAIAIVCVALAIGCAASPARDKRTPFDPANFFGGGAFGAAFAGFPFGGPSAFAGSYPSPFFYRPWFYVPVFEPPKPWYKGENVCTETKESELSNIPQDWFSDGSFGDWNQQSESCRGSNTKYVCVERKTSSEGTKLVATKYECCYGFERPKDWSPGCVEIDLRALLPTLRLLGNSEMVALAEGAGWGGPLRSRNYSLFCPAEGALARITRDGVTPSGLLERHLVPGFVREEDFFDGQLLQTEDPETRLRINIYHTPEKVVTANCVLLLARGWPRLARNGVIHGVDRILPRPLYKTVADLVAGDPQFSTLKAILSAAGLVQRLRDPRGNFTLFAPTDTAFARARITHQNQRRCLQGLMRRHLLERAVCSAAGGSYGLRRDPHGKLYVGGAQVVVRDWVTHNGVVHVLDTVLSAASGRRVVEAMRELRLSQFLSLVEAEGLGDAFDASEDAAFFLPADSAFLQGASSRAVESLRRQNGSLAEALLYHMAAGPVQLNSPHQLISSRAENSSLRIHVQLGKGAPRVLVQCATVISADHQICGGTLHVIDRFLVPPRLTLLQLLERTPGFSLLARLVRLAGLGTLGEPLAPRTLLAPTDDAFGGELSAEDAAGLVRMHILPGAQCCAQLKDDFSLGRQRARALDGSLLALGRAPRSGMLLVGGARVVDCDVMAVDGVLHVVDSLVRHDAA